jgi:3-dehydroquinate dehydratase type I
MGKPKICVVITATGVGEAIREINEVEQFQPDIIEVRLDYLKDHDELYHIREATKLSLIATNRPLAQGGKYKGNEKQRLEILREASTAGFNFIDLEVTMKSAKKTGMELKDNGSKLILSHHDFSSTPEMDELERIMGMGIEAGADICKIIGTSLSLKDNLKYLWFLDKHRDVKLICFGMGQAGKISRILSPLFGGFFTYASLSKGRESAPGQLTIKELQEIYSLLGVDIL